jgi:hypothetical protein
LAILGVAPMASMVTSAPLSASRSSSSGTASASLDFSAVACCPRTSRWRLAQAETRCSGERPLARSWLRREVLPSIATMSGAASRRPSTQAAKAARNSAGSSPETTSPSVSWLGTPRSKGRNRRRNPSLPRPQRTTSTKSSAPASVAQSTSSSTSGSGYTTFQLWRGSSSAEKCSSNDVPPIKGLPTRGPS